MRSWLAYRVERGYAKSSNARALSAVRTFFKYLNNHAGIRNLAALQVPTPKLDKPLPKAPDMAQARATMSGLEENAEPWIGARNHAIAMLLYGCGLRISETLNLTIGDVAATNESIRILGKGKRGARSLTREEAREAMGMLLDEKVEESQLGAFLMLLRHKEESPEELAGFTQAVRERLDAPALNVDVDWPTYAGKKRHLPWFLLAAKCLAQHGVRILMHGGGALR